MDHQWKDPVHIEESRNLGEKDGIDDATRPLRTLREGVGLCCQRETHILQQGRVVGTWMGL